MTELIGLRPSFISTLSLKDLERLRQVVKRVHLSYVKEYQRQEPTDHEADKLIEALGPEIAERMLKAAIESKFLV